MKSLDHDTASTIRSENLNTHRGARVRLQPLIHSVGVEETWQAAVKDPNGLNVVDLFCGAGGMSLGFRQADFTIAVGIDLEADACETHAANLPSKTLCTDITSIEEPAEAIQDLGVPRVDVVIGGPPCQGFSIVGRGKMKTLSPEVRAEAEARNLLYREFVRFVEALQPLFFVMENVPHLSSFADGVIAQAIANDFGRLGYRVYHELMDAAEYGVPQTRKRLFFIGSRIGWVYRRPRRTHGDTQSVRTLADAIGDLPVVHAPSLTEELTYVPRERPELKASAEYPQLMRSGMPAGQRDRLYHHVVRPVRADDATIFRAMQPGGKYRDVDPRYRRYAMKRSADGSDEYFADRYYKGDRQ